MTDEQRAVLHAAAIWRDSLIPNTSTAGQVAVRRLVDAVDAWAAASTATNDGGSQ